MTAKQRDTARTSAVAALKERAAQLRTEPVYTVRARRGSKPAAPKPLPAIDINQEIARERKLRNDNAEQDITLKRTSLRLLFRFLTAETVLIFMFAFFQATHWPSNFGLEEWSFKLLIGATIAQITGMVFVAVRYLFPNERNHRSR